MVIKGGVRKMGKYCSSHVCERTTQELRFFVEQSKDSGRRRNALAELARRVAHDQQSTARDVLTDLSTGKGPGG